MPKIGILTLGKAFNYGAYLQAYAIQEKIESMGHEVLMINSEVFKSTRIRYRTLISKRLMKLVFNYKKYRAFRAAWRKLNFESGNTIKIGEKLDIVVLGSDEIWNVINPTFHSVPEYFGCGLSASHVISYAPSASESTLESIMSHPDAVAGISALTHISVRDQHTMNIVKDATGRDATLVLDPTFLVDLTGMAVPTEHRNYILIYTYGFSNERIEMVRNFAKARGLKLLSAGFRNVWCDESIPASPFEFLGLVKAAEYIFTDTFHGTIFSIQFRKNFVSFAENKMKVRYLLKSLGLDDRSAITEQGFNVCNDKPIDYEAVFKRIEHLRKDSIEFLESSISSVKVVKPFVDLK